VVIRIKILGRCFIIGIPFNWSGLVVNILLARFTPVVVLDVWGWLLLFLLEALGLRFVVVELSDRFFVVLSPLHWRRLILVE
jgi:hypothetical protein